MLQVSVYLLEVNVCVTGKCSVPSINVGTHTCLFNFGVECFSMVMLNIVLSLPSCPSL